MKKDIKFGIMQGRLLPNFKNQYQAFPIGSWREEFELAKDIGLNRIEFIVDAYLYSFNPILSKDGLEIIKNLSKKNRIYIKSICADIFMHWPLNNIIRSEINFLGSILETMICNLSELGGSDIVIPFVDNSKILTNTQAKNIVNFIDEFKNLCESKNINLSLETDLNPEDFYALISKFSNSKVTINYDSGNSASLGYKFKDEIELYGEKISNIHIKDRKYKGGPVLLGQGEAELEFVKEFIYNDFKGEVVTFQSFRDSKPLETFKKQFKFFSAI